MNPVEELFPKLGGGPYFSIGLKPPTSKVQVVHAFKVSWIFWGCDFWWLQFWGDVEFPLLTNSGKFNI